MKNILNGCGGTFSVSLQCEAAFAEKSGRRAIFCSHNSFADSSKKVFVSPFCVYRFFIFQYGLCATTELQLYVYVYLLSYYDFFSPLLFRKYYTRSCKAFQVSSWSGRKVVPPLTNMKVSKLQKNLTKCSFMGALVEADGGTLSDWVPVADRALLMASIFLTYIAGVIPVGKQLTDVRDNANNTVPKNSNLSGR